MTYLRLCLHVTVILDIFGLKSVRIYLEIIIALSIYPVDLHVVLHDVFDCFDDSSSHLLEIYM